jgi:hypothetical protein
MRTLPTYLSMTVVLLAGLASRAEAPPGTVTGVGAYELKRQPEFLRVHVDVLAKGKDIKESLAKLRERRLAAQKSLEAMGAAANAIEFGDPTVTTEKFDRQQSMQRMMMAQMAMAQGKKAAKKPKEAQPVIVSCSLKAEIRLAATDPEERVILTHALEKRIKTADLGGLKDMKQASPQDEELAQEQVGEEMDPDQAHQPKPGEPAIFYVSPIPVKDRERALAEAFKKAKRHAGHLANAAGAELGPIHHIEDSSPSNSQMEDYSGMENPFMYRYMQRTQDWTRESNGGDDRESTEAIGLEPGKVVFRVVLSASFELKRPADK